MKLYVMDAFANRIFGGNQAGVALPDRELSDETMRQIAAEMKHSETAFIHMEPDGSVSPALFHPRRGGGPVRPRHGGVLRPAAAAGEDRRRRPHGPYEGRGAEHHRQGRYCLDGYGAAAADRRHPGSGARRAVRRLWPDGGGLPGRDISHGWCPPVWRIL